jgi:hypothetical protein
MRLVEQDHAVEIRRQPFEQLLEAGLLAGAAAQRGIGGKEDAIACLILASGLILESGWMSSAMPPSACQSRRASSIRYLNCLGCLTSLLRGWTWAFLGNGRTAARSALLFLPLLQGWPGCAGRGYA